MSRFLRSKRPPPNLGRWKSFLFKKWPFFTILGKFQLDSSFESNCWIYPKSVGFVSIYPFRRSRRFSAGVAGSETISIDENLSLTRKGTRFLWSNRPPQTLDAEIHFWSKNGHFFSHFGPMSIRFKLWVKFLKIFQILRNQTSSFLLLVYSHVFETLYTIILPKSCVAHLKFQVLCFVHDFYCLKIGIRYIRHSHSSMYTSQDLNSALAMKIITLWSMWYEVWTLNCRSL